MYQNIKYFMADVDGTLTDGKIYISENGELMKAFNIKDGYALHDLLPDNGITPVIVTGRKSKIVENRAKELEIDFVFQGIKDKLSFMRKFAEERNVTLSQISFFGDDIIDLACIKECGFGGCPSDAADAVKEVADFITTAKGGDGAAREFAQELVRREKCQSQ